MDNLKFSAEDEHNEAKVYLAFAKTARKEGFEDIAILFEQTAEVEKYHEAIFLELYEQMKEGSLYKKLLLQRGFARLADTRRQAKKGGKNVLYAKRNKARYS